MTPAEQLIEKGHKEGRKEGHLLGRIETLRKTIEMVLTSRNVTLSEAGRAQLGECTDPNQLERWLERALGAQAEHDVFAAS